MEKLLALTLSGSALALLLFLLKRFILKKMPSTVYYYAWLLVLLRFLLPLPGFVPTERTAAEPVSVQPAVITEQTAEKPVSFLQPVTVPSETAEKPAVSVVPAAEKETEPVVTPEPAPAPAEKKLSIDWKSPTLWLTVWAIGAAVCFVVPLVSYMVFSRKLYRTLEEPDLFARTLYASLPGKKPALYCSSAVKTPLMSGVIHPRIILPACPYDEELLGNILRHELTHYRRKDTLYKWFAVAVLSLQWFNPIAWLARREINRSCELSCDEMLLRSMDREEKQSYGNTLLHMAATSRLPAGVVATTFSTEKKNLKERLEQIMQYKHSGARTLATVLALVLLAGCGVAAGPLNDANETGKNSPEPVSLEAVQVSTVDEFLAAIAPDTVIELAAGTYDLSTASDYGKDSANPYYVWNEVYPGNDKGTTAELELRNLRNLTIIGSGLNKTTIAAVPRYANVLKFSGCRDIRVADLTAGHTKEPGFCAGGVLYFDSCTGAQVENCGLFGCGTVGVSAYNTVDLTVIGSDIYECSFGAVELFGSRNVRIENCDIHDHGKRAGQGDAMYLFSAYDSNGFTIFNNRIRDNDVQNMLVTGRTKDTLFLSNEIFGNTIVTSMFTFEQYGAVVDGCSFTDNAMTGNRWYNSTGTFACDAEGNELDANALSAMTLRQIDPASILPVSITKPMTEVPAGGLVEVTTVDEFLAAIGPDRTIVLSGEKEFDLSEAENYGGVSGEYYYWSESFDGPELVIHDVSGLTIRGGSADAAATVLSAVPRYANVLNFRDCENIQLFDFTAGHTKEPGSCAGGVLNLQSCYDVKLDHMRLYGCGILGIQTANCGKIDVERSEIYECSYGAAQFYQTDGIVFNDCDIHDVPSPMLRFTECGDKVWNGEAISFLNGEYDVDEDGKLTYPAGGSMYYTESLPTGAGSVMPFGIQISVHDVIITGDFTMRLSIGEKGDVLLKATASDGSTTGFTWSVDREGILELTPSEDGSECLIHQIGVYHEGVRITVEKGDLTGTVYCHAYE